MRIKISKIKVKPGRRETVPAHIEELSKSISEIGLLNPITVEQDYTLIAGLHRLEAVKLLGWTDVECTVTSLAGLQAELAELDENFVRSDLSAVEFGELLLRRKDIYETLHPETKKGTAQAAGMNRALGNNVNGTVPSTSNSFAADTAEKLGVSRSTVERQIRIAKGLIPEVREILRHTDISKKAAIKLARLSPEHQIVAAKLLLAGQIKSVEEYQPDSFADNSMLSEAHSSNRGEKTNNITSSTLDKTACPQKEQTPDEVTELPFTLGGKQFSSVKEAVADLKDPNKDCSCTPDSFLAEITEFVKKFYQEIEWFHIPYYEIVFPELSSVQYDYFRQEMDSIHEAVRELNDKVKKGRTQIEQTK